MTIRIINNFCIVMHYCYTKSVYAVLVICLYMEKFLVFKFINKLGNHRIPNDLENLELSGNLGWPGKV